MSTVNKEHHPSATTADPRQAAAALQVQLIECVSSLIQSTAESDRQRQDLLQSALNGVSITEFTRRQNATDEKLDKVVSSLQILVSNLATDRAHTAKCFSILESQMCVCIDSACKAMESKILASRKEAQEESTKTYDFVNKCHGFHMGALKAVYSNVTEIQKQVGAVGDVNTRPSETTPTETVTMASRLMALEQRLDSVFLSLMEASGKLSEIQHLATTGFRPVVYIPTTCREVGVNTEVDETEDSDLKKFLDEILDASSVGDASNTSEGDSIETYKGASFTSGEAQDEDNFDRRLPFSQKCLKSSVDESSDNPWTKTTSDTREHNVGKSSEDPSESARTTPVTQTVENPPEESSTVETPVPGCTEDRVPSEVGQIQTGDQVGGDLIPKSDKPAILVATLSPETIIPGEHESSNHDHRRSGSTESTAVTSLRDLQDLQDGCVQESWQDESSDDEGLQADTPRSPHSLTIDPAKLSLVPVKDFNHNPWHTSGFLSDSPLSSLDSDSDEPEEPESNNDSSPSIPLSRLPTRGESSTSIPKKKKDERRRKRREFRCTSCGNSFPNQKRIHRHWRSEQCWGSTGTEGIKPKKRRKTWHGSTDSKKKRVKFQEEATSSESEDGGLGREIVLCDGCEQSYHFKCVGITRQLSEKETFMCPSCTKSGSKRTSGCKSQKKNPHTTPSSLKNPKEVCVASDCAFADHDSDGEFFVVERVIGRAHSDSVNEKGKSTYLWLVKWFGYTLDHCSWIPSCNMGDPDQLIDTFYSEALGEGVDASPGLPLVLLKEAAEAGIFGVQT